MFFTKTPITLKDKPAARLDVIDIGGEPFHSSAVVFIDALKKVDRVSDDLLKTVLDRFYTHYPKFKSQIPYLTPAERMGMHIQGPRRSEMVECMAYVLRQLAMDEIFKNFLNYKDIFEGLDPLTPKSYLRDPTTPLPICALKALTQALDVMIVLSFVEPGKILRKRKGYTNSLANTATLKLTLQVQGDRCFPVVKNKADFAYVGKLAITSPQPTESEKDRTATIAEIVALIAEDNERLLHTYSQWHQNLLTMVVGEELTTERLFDLYIEFLPVKDEIDNTTELFAKLTGSFKTPVLTGEVTDSKQEINELIAKKLAGLISSGEIKLEPFFDRLEEYTGHPTKIHHL